MTRRYRTYKGQTCVYCATEASSKAPDHVFARGFFPVEERNNLPQVPSCLKCNSDKAALEHYLLSILPFGGESPASSKMLSEAVPRRLAQNRKLHREISAGHRKIWVHRGNLILPSVAIPFDTKRLFALFEFIARGLVAYHWDQIIPGTHASRAGMFSAPGECYMKDLFRMRSAAMAQGQLGAGTILYEGVQGFDDPFLSIWRFRLYGGMTVTGDPKAPTEVASDVWATTSRSELGSFFELDAPDQRTD